MAGFGNRLAFVADRRPPAAAAMKPGVPIRWDTLLAGTSKGKTILKCGGAHTIFMQGEAADALFFLVAGKVQLAVTSDEGKEAIVATLGPGEFFGEGCLAGQLMRMGTAMSASDCTLIRVEKAAMARVLDDDQVLSAVFIGQLLSRIVRYEADLVDQIFNSSEKRLARMLLLLSHF